MRYSDLTGPDLISILQTKTKQHIDASKKALHRGPGGTPSKNVPGTFFS